MLRTEMVLPNQTSKHQTFKFCIVVLFTYWEVAMLLSLFYKLKISQMSEMAPAG